MAGSETHTTESHIRDLPTLQVAPPDLRGRPRPDRMFAAMRAVIRTYEWFTRSSHLRRPPIQAVDRERTLVVAEVRVEADGVRSFRLTAPDGAALPAWQPGCHLDLQLPSGRRRHYSLCGDPTDRHHYRIAVRRIPDGGGSQELHDTVHPGTTLTIHGPRNAFPYIPADSYLFIAGGIGITPILPMVTHAAASGTPWQLIYTGRRLDTMPFLDELATLDAERIWIRPDDEYGVPRSGAELLAHAPTGARVYCCGPPSMITAIRHDLPTSPATALHYERFSPPPILDGHPFEIELTSSKQILTVPADQSALDTIRQIRPDIAYSCQQGFCGTCRTRVLSGQIDHRDHVLTDTEHTDTMTICVSRAHDGRITLDL
ncbi:MAG: PDR/VanB family oxidoreductase [Pseudonocardiaceae bacterium]